VRTRRGVSTGLGASEPGRAARAQNYEIWSAKVADLVPHAAGFGIVSGPAATDRGRVRQRKRDMVEGLNALFAALRPRQEKKQAEREEKMWAEAIPLLAWADGSRSARFCGCPMKNSSTTPLGWRPDGNTPCKIACTCPLIAL
jgi:hypothetical protein